MGDVHEDAERVHLRDQLAARCVDAVPNRRAADLAVGEGVDAGLGAELDHAHPQPVKRRAGR